MRRKKLLVILGAGSSIPLGMPSVSSLDALMKLWSAEWAAVERDTNFFMELWRNAEQYYRESKPQRWPNFEEILGDLAALAHWMAPAPFGNTLRLINGAAAPASMSFRHGTLPWGPSSSIQNQLTYLLIRLAGHMRSVCKGGVGGPANAAYKKFLSSLRDSFDLGIYNLNYDSCALSVFPSAFTGFDDTGNFDPLRVHDLRWRYWFRCRRWDFIYHLHGSVHNTLVGHFGNAIRWQRDLNVHFDDGDEGRSARELSDRKLLPKTSLIAGRFKLDQLLIEPFHSFYASLSRHAYEADAILLGGYGFGDTHVNRAIQARLEQPTSRPRVMVLTRSSCRTDPMDFRKDDWAWNLSIALNVDLNSFREPGHFAPPVVKELIDRKGFEVSPGATAIWHGGFVEAVERRDSILSWLKGQASDTVLAAQ
jgi:hypothetical protein